MKAPPFAFALRPGLLCTALLAALAGADAQVVGPMVGQVSPTGARLLYRPGDSVKDLRLTVLTPQGVAVATNTVTSAADSDYVAKFHVTGLTPETRYLYRIDDVTGNPAGTLLAGNDGTCSFKTALPPGRNGVFTAAFLSCSDGTSEPVYERMSILGVDALVLGGDTPYVDSGTLNTVRQIHRIFLTRPSIAALLRNTSTTATWDDHDFGLNNGNGATFGGKAVTRQVFVEYRAHDQYGTGTEGVYNKVDFGLMEVFLLDPRWFSQTAPSPVDPAQKTCFGAAQWTWILDAIQQSRAPFKVLLMGQVWQDKKNTETDDMYTYWYERDALLDQVKQRRIPGVVLVGGDIHLSRHLIHRQRIGYDLHDFVTSPAHTSTIPTLDVYNPDLEWSAVVGRQFLTLTVDTRVRPAVLTARYIQHDGTVLRTVTVPYNELIPREGAGLGRDLRALWTFDTDGANASVLGARVNAAPVGGAGVGSTPGVRGNAASFTRSAGQYLLVSRSVLPENCATHTVSLWCRPATLPAHGSAERSFLLETTPEGVISAGNTGYAISLGFAAGATADKVNLQLFTRTLQPAVSVTTAPTELAQGGFNTQLDRSLFTNAWTHVALTGNSTNLVVYINGQQAASHALPVSGPIAENGGLVIGGHRGGTGRNFDGLIDEVAVWSRVLLPAEIASLHNGGSPPALPTTATDVDTDADTLPDWWEHDHALNPADNTDAIADGDGDGVPAFVEFAIGTSPLHNDIAFYQYLRGVASGRPATAAAYRNPADNRITFEGTLESSANLADWTPVPLNTPGAGVTALNDLLHLAVPQAGGTPTYYRFRASQPAE